MHSDVTVEHTTLVLTLEKFGAGQSVLEDLKFFQINCRNSSRNFIEILKNVGQPWL